MTNELTADDLRRARMYVSRPDLTTLATSNEWITALLDHIASTTDQPTDNPKKEGS